MVGNSVGGGLPVGEGTSTGVGNAKVGDGAGEAVDDSLGDGVTMGEETGVGVGDGVGVGVGIKFVQ